MYTEISARIGLEAKNLGSTKSLSTKNSLEVNLQKEKSWSCDDAAYFLVGSSVTR